MKLRLKQWKEGDFDGLVIKFCFIQSKPIYQNSPTSIAKKFNNFMLSEKVNTPLILLSDTESDEMLPTT